MCIVSTSILPVSKPMPRNLIKIKFLTILEFSAESYNINITNLSPIGKPMRTADVSIFG